MLQATSKILDTRSDAERASQLQFADASQWEYEDEYDDSYDDLAPFGNDGVADVEGMICCSFSFLLALHGTVVWVVLLEIST